MVKFIQRSFAHAVAHCSEGIQDKLFAIDNALKHNNTDEALHTLHELTPTTQNGYQPLDYEMLGRLYERIGKTHEGTNHVELRRICFSQAETLYTKAGKRDRANWVFRNLKFTATNKLIKYRRG